MYALTKRPSRLNRNGWAYYLAALIPALDPALPVFARASAVGYRRAKNLLDCPPGLIGNPP